MYPLVMNYFQKCFIAEILANQPFISWTDWKDVTIFLYYFKRKHVKSGIMQVGSFSSIS